MVASVPLLTPRPVLVVELVGVSLSGVVGGTKPWMVLETRADTVTRLRSGEARRVCGVVELSEELVRVRFVFVPFRNTPGDVFMEPDGDFTLSTTTPGEAAAEGEEGLEVFGDTDVEPPSWTGGRGARYFTLPDWGSGRLDGVVEEDTFVAGLSDGTGGAGAGYLIDLGLGARGLCGSPSDGWGLSGSMDGCGGDTGSADRLREDGPLPGSLAWFSEHLLSARRVNS